MVHVLESFQQAELSKHFKHMQAAIKRNQGLAVYRTIWKEPSNIVHMISTEPFFFLQKKKNA